MKQKKAGPKMNLKKETVSNLSEETMNALKGGVVTTWHCGPISAHDTVCNQGINCDIMR